MSSSEILAVFAAAGADVAPVFVALLVWMFAISVVRFIISFFVKGRVTG